MEDLIEMGTISSRGQIAIPSDIRMKMGLKEGSKVLFVVSNDTLLVKKVTQQTFAQITKPLKEVAKSAGMKEKNVPSIVHRFRQIKK